MNVYSPESGCHTIISNINSSAIRNAAANVSLWQIGQNCSNIVVTNNEICSIGNNCLVIVIIKDNQDNIIVFEEIEFMQRNIPCEGDPVLLPQIASTFNSCQENVNDLGGTFGCKRCSGTCAQVINGKTYTKEHKGVDIFGTVGDNIHSMYGGVIIRASLMCPPGATNSSNSPSFPSCTTSPPTANKCVDDLGNQVKIRSTIPGHGTMEILYGHLNSISVTCGQNINQGHMIITMGRTGNFLQGTITHTHIQAKDAGTQNIINIENLMATKFNISPSGNTNTVSVDSGIDPCN